MAILRSLVSSVSRLINASPSGPALQHVRNSYCDARMRRDLKRRRICAQWAPERVRWMAMKRNDILPVEIRKIADDAMITRVPRVTSLQQLTWRCVLTSRPRGCVHRWHLSRFIFRNLVDYNRLGGVQRAMW